MSRWSAHARSWDGNRFGSLVRWFITPLVNTGAREDLLIALIGRERGIWRRAHGGG
jgi:hypothetical protein